MATVNNTGTKVEYWDLADLWQRIDPRNPKGHDLPGIKQSMRTLGFIEPIIHDGRTGKVIAGHGRIEALAELRYECGTCNPAGVKRRRRDGAWLVPVNVGWSSLNDDQAAAALIALNRYTERGGWRPDALTDLLRILDDELLQLAGYSTAELDDLMASLDQPVEMPGGPTGAQLAPMTDRADALPTRQAQGLREVGIMFTVDDHRQFQDHVTRLRRVYGVDVLGVVVLRALSEAVAAHA